MIEDKGVDKQKDEYMKKDKEILGKSLFYRINVLMRKYQSKNSFLIFR